MRQAEKQIPFLQDYIAAEKANFLSALVNLVDTAIEHPALFRRDEAGMMTQEHREVAIMNFILAHQN